MNAEMTELIDKFKRNSKLSIADQDIFEKELALELAKGIYTDDIETILCEGPVDNSMKVLAKYLSDLKVEDANAYVNKFLKSDRIQENKGGTSGIRIVFLYCSLWKLCESQTQTIEKLFNAMVKFSYKYGSFKNGKGETNKKVVDLIRKNVLPLFEDASKIINLGFVNNEKTWIKIRNLFVEASVEGENVNPDIVQKVFYWLKSANKDMGKISEEYLLDKVLKKNECGTKVELPKENEEKPATVPVEAAVDKPQVKKEENGSESSRKLIEAMVSVILAESKEILNIKSDIVSLKQKSGEMQLQIVNASDKQTQQEESIRNLISEKFDLQRINRDLTAKITELEQLVEKQKREIDDRKQFTDTVARNREKQSEEQLNKLAAKLRVDYRDFCEAKDMDMTIDLGENMREQLGAVFSILERNGIKLR